MVYKIQDQENMEYSSKSNTNKWGTLLTITFLNERMIGREDI